MMNLYIWYNGKKNQHLAKDQKAVLLYGYYKAQLRICICSDGQNTARGINIEHIISISEPIFKILYQSAASHTK